MINSKDLVIRKCACGRKFPADKDSEETKCLSCRIAKDRQKTNFVRRENSVCR